MDLIPFLETPEDGNGVFHRGFPNHDRLEATLQSRILFDVFPVFVESSGANGPQLSAGQRRFEHVGCIHRSLGRARTYQRVKLIDEENHPAFGLLDFLEKRLQTVLELAAELGPGHERPDVQCEKPLVLQRLGNVSAHDPVRQSLGDGGFSYSGLADENRVVLRPPGENLHHTADFIVPADYRIQLALVHQNTEILCEALEGLVLVFRTLIRDTLAPPDLCHTSQEILSGDSLPLEEVLLVIGDHEKQVFRRNKGILQALGFLERIVENLPQCRGDVDLRGRPIGLGHLLQFLLQFLTEPAQVHAHLLEDGPDDALTLFDKSPQEMERSDLSAVPLLTDLLSCLQSLLGLDRHLVKSHAAHSCIPFLSPEFFYMRSHGTRHGRQVVPAFQERHDASAGRFLRELAQHSGHSPIPVIRQLHTRQGVHPVGVEAGGDQHETGFELPGTRENLLLERLYVGIVTRSRRQGYVQGETSFPSACAISRRSGSGVMRILVDARVENVRRFAERVLGPVSVMDVPIQNQDPLDLVLLLYVDRGDRDVVEQAEAHRAIPLGVVPRGSHGTEGSANLPIHHRVHRCQSCSCGRERRMVRLRAGGCVPIVQQSPTSVADILHKLDILGCMNLLYPLNRRRRRLDVHELLLQPRLFQMADDGLEARRRLRMRGPHVVFQIHRRVNQADLSHISSLPSLDYARIPRLGACIIQAEKPRSRCRRTASWEKQCVFYFGLALRFSASLFHALSVERHLQGILRLHGNECLCIIQTSPHFSPAPPRTFVQASENRLKGQEGNRCSETW